MVLFGDGGCTELMSSVIPWEITAKLSFRNPRDDNSRAAAANVLQPWRQRIHPVKFVGAGVQLRCPTVDLLDRRAWGIWHHTVNRAGAQTTSHTSDTWTISCSCSRAGGFFFLTTVALGCSGLEHDRWMGVSLSGTFPSQQTLTSVGQWASPHIV